MLKHLIRKGVDINEKETVDNRGLRYLWFFLLLHAEMTQVVLQVKIKLQ